MKSELENRIIESGVALAKLLPGVGPFIGLFDDLNKIWANQPDLEKRAIEIQFDLVGNLYQMIETKDSAARARLTSIEEKVDNYAKSAEQLRAGLSLVKDELSYLPNRSEGFLRIILSSWISNGLEDERLPNDFHFAAKYLSDLDCRILLYVYDREDNYGGFTTDMLSHDTKDLFHTRELLGSLAHLRDFGFLKAASPVPDDWKNQIWSPLLVDVDEFCQKLKFLPTIAVMPNYTHYPGIAAIRENGSLDSYIQSLSEKADLRGFMAGLSAVRRHPIRGYQWKAVVARTGSQRGFTKDTDWQGSNWQFQSAQEAIEACNPVLIQDGQDPDWIYISS